MKEFKDKLIEHFKTEEYCADWIAVSDVITIITRLAEEYNQDITKVNQEPKTRIERIRSMSVEELADAILEKSVISTEIDFCQYFEQCLEDIQESECKKCLIKWLNSPEQPKAKVPTEHFEKRFNTVT